MLILALTAVRVFVLQGADVRDHGMHPRLGIGDTVIVDRTANEYAPGDIVVFYRADIPFMRRIVGMPGDRVGMEDGVVTVNGIAAETQPRGTATYKDVTAQDPAGLGERTCERTLESHSLTFYEICRNDGPDERPRTLQPRYVGPGHYWTLCDNRFHCPGDSRELGPIAKGAIRGRVAWRMSRAADLEPSWTDRLLGRWEGL